MADDKRTKPMLDWVITNVIQFQEFLDWEGRNRSLTLKREAHKRAVNESRRKVWDF